MAADSQEFDWNPRPSAAQDTGLVITPQLFSDMKILECLSEPKALESLGLNWLESTDIRVLNPTSDESSAPDTDPGTPIGPGPVGGPEFVPSGGEIEENGNVSAISSINPSSPVSDLVPQSMNVVNGAPVWDVNHSEPNTQPKKKSSVQSSRVRYRGLLFSPTEPSILAEKYVVMGLIDASTACAVHIHTHEKYHIKLVTSKAASEVGAQQAMLDSDVGVRAPLEIIRPPGGQRAWLVFAPHFGDLHSYVRLRRRLREAETQRLFTQIATTVYKCHQVGLILRDLKLRKFVFTDSSREEVVLESLEDSVLAGNSDLLHDKHGCPAYVAPEILTSSSYSGKHADMWGLGVILYTMLIGKYPFHNSDTSALFAKIRHGKYTLPDWVSSRARHLIMGLLRKQPSLRLTAEEVLDHPWLTRPPRDHSSKDMLEHIVPLGLPQKSLKKLM